MYQGIHCALTAAFCLLRVASEIAYDALCRQLPGRNL